MKAEFFNDISPKLQKKLGRNETVTYQILNIRPDEDNPGAFLMPYSVNVPSTDSVYDPEKDEWVDIAFINQIRADGKAVFGDISFEKSNAGTITLKGSVPNHQKIFQYLEISNYNQSNPNRATSRAALYRKIDAKSDAEQDRKERLVYLNALNRAAQLSDEEVRFVASSLGIKLKGTQVEIRNKVEAFAEEYSDEFLAIIEQQTNRTESLIREAVDLGIISHNARSGKFVWIDSEEEIFVYKKKVGIKAFYEFAEYLQTEDAEQLQAIETAVNARRDNP
jgi:hypothetical protein